MKCNSCKADALPDRKKCQACLDKDSQRVVKIQQARRAKGLCTRCEEPAEPDRSFCAVHLAYANQLYYAKKLGLGRSKVGASVTKVSRRSSP